MTKRECGWCGRHIGLSELTGRLAYHHFPQGQFAPYAWIKAGERCPGTGEAGRMLALLVKSSPLV